MDDEVYEVGVVNEQGADIERLQNELEEVSAKLEKVEFEKKLTIAFAEEGVIDLDAALKLAEQGKDATEIVAELRDKKPYLFRGKKGQSSEMTSGVKRREASNDKSKEKLGSIAEVARRSGSRKDLCEYLKLRRTLLRKNSG